jgi:hypothetical protein
VLLAETDRLLDELRPQLHRWELDLIERGAQNMIESWIRREFESRELWQRNPMDTVLKGGFGIDPLLKERFKYQFHGLVAGVTTAKDVRTVHLYRRKTPKDFKEHQREKLLLEYAPYFSAAWNGVREVRVEVEGLSDCRTLLLFCPEGYLPPRKDDTLQVINLATREGTAVELADFVRNQLAEAKQLAVAGKMIANPEDHCNYCSYSELCRVSRFGGEDFDPFLSGGDHVE